MTTVPLARARDRGRYLLRCHPEWWIAVLAAAAWPAIVLTSHPAASPHGGHAHGSVAAPALPLVATALMVVAMMVPLCLPAARYVALTSYRARRHRAQAAFLAGYVAVWLGVAAALHLVVRGVSDATTPAAALGTAFALAAAWQLSPAQRRAVRRCRRTASLASEGWRASADCIRFGMTSAALCSATCWALMAAATAAGHALPATGAIFLVQLHDRVRGGAAAAVGALGVAALVV
jgi:predicted metal-binding membrane protein